MTLKLIDSIFKGESLDYEAFCSIFTQDREKGEGRLASAASQRSLKSSDSIEISCSWLERFFKNS